MRELHAAHADSLTGPWIEHQANPVRSGFQASRPGGTAFEIDGVLHLPVQDCAETYGAAIGVLRIDTLTPTRFQASVVRRHEAEGLSEGYADGFHTLSGQGDLVCIDVKSIQRSRAEGWIRTQYKVRRILGLNGPRSRPRTDAPPARSAGAA